MKRLFLVLGVMAVLAAGLRADEIRLKDGSTIIGTIVEFENESFKVQTAYGFAMVRKDSIAQITPSDQTKASDQQKSAVEGTSNTNVSPAPVAVSSPGLKAGAQPAVARRAAAVRNTAPSDKGSRTLPETALRMPAPNPRPPALAPVAAITSADTSAPISPEAALSVAPAPAAPIRESVRGSVYANDTYGFQFYRPPGWDLMPEARKAMPNAVTAMGTSDQTTLFVVGREPARGSLQVQAENAQRALQKIYENYREVSSSQRSIGGLPAIQWQFRGMADGHDWSVTALTIAHGGDVFTLLGMTYADSDIIQIRENVIAKMAASVQFNPAH
jgi:hypothetical protein